MDRNKQFACPLTIRARTLERSCVGSGMSVRVNIAFVQANERNRATAIWAFKDQDVRFHNGAEYTP